VRIGDAACTPGTFFYSCKERDPMRTMPSRIRISCASQSTLSVECETIQQPCRHRWSVLLYSMHVQQILITWSTMSQFHSETAASNVTATQAFLSVL
jgi:hypothetical protein